MSINRNFKGVWIPAAIWLIEGLNPTKRCILAEIDSLSKNGKPCFARNSHFSTLFGVSVPTVSRSLAALHHERLILMWYDEGRRLLLPDYEGVSALSPNQIDKANQNDKHVSPNQNDRPPNQNDKEGVIKMIRGSNQNDIHRIQLDNKLENNENTFNERRNKSDAPNSDLVNATPGKKKVARKKKMSVLFSETEYYDDYENFVARFEGSDFVVADLEFYHESVKNWADSTGNLRKDWIAVARTFMLNDRRDNKLVLNSKTKKLKTNGKGNSKEGNTVVNVEQAKRIAGL